MKKIFVCLLVMCIFSNLIFAGDVAEYVDLGFSPNGQYYVFGQYGITDKEFIPYAEIYTVDVAKNDFVKGAVFKTSVNDSTKNSLAVYEDLYKKNKAVLDKYTGTPVSLDNTLYLRGPEDKDSSQEIIFKDFNNSTEENEIFYYVSVVKNVNGYGKNAKSSFFISVERKDSNGNVLSRQVAGNPDFQRSGITDYLIRKIVTDNSGKSLVFEVEKRLEDSKGTSFRYMVETLILK